MGARCNFNIVVDSTWLDVDPTCPTQLVQDDDCELTETVPTRIATNGTDPSGTDVTGNVATVAALSGAFGVFGVLMFICSIMLIVFVVQKKRKQRTPRYCPVVLLDSNSNVIQ